MAPGLQGGADERAHDRLDLDNTNCALPHRDFPQQVQDSIVTSGVSTQKGNPRVNLLRGILLVDTVYYYCYRQESGTLTIRGSHTFLAMVSEAGPLAMEVENVDNHRSRCVAEGAFHRRM